MNLSSSSKVTVLSSGVVAGTTDVDPTGVDMTGYEAVLFLVTFSTITSGAVTSVKAQQSSDDSTYNDLLGSAQTVADTADDKVFIIDVINPSDRYVKPYIDRATQNAVVSSIVAIQYNPRLMPAVDDSSVGGSVVLASVAEGTA